MEYKLGLVLYVGVLNINILIFLLKIITVVQKQIKSNVLQYFSDAYDLVTACGSGAHFRRGSESGGGLWDQNEGGDKLSSKERSFVLNTSFY
jgi:hypothetical protein